MLIMGALVAAAPVGATPTPQPIATRLQDGALDPADLGWMRGRFPGATAQEQADWSAARNWLDQCRAERVAAVRAELRALGVDPVALAQGAYGAEPCASADAIATGQYDFADAAAFDQAAQDAWNVLAVFKHGMKLTSTGLPYDPKWASEDVFTLLFAPVREQAYRAAMSWRANEGGPPIADATWTVLKPLLWLHAQREDQRNTTMLKAMVDKSGWPRISAVGERASGSAWLIVQHADHDPAFQLRALRLMEPLVVAGEVTKKNYAYLYDRVMLKLRGKQRYATQVECKGGKRSPRPLESSGDIDLLRAHVDLEPLATYIAGMDKHFDECPAG